MYLGKELLSFSERGPRMLAEQEEQAETPKSFIYLTIIVKCFPNQDSSVKYVKVFIGHKKYTP
jgi:hypothetical protein